MEDFGLQAILEKMNSLITPLISGPFWDTSNIFVQFWIFSQSLSRQKIQLKVTLVILSERMFHSKMVNLACSTMPIWEVALLDQYLCLRVRKLPFTHQESAENWF